MKKVKNIFGLGSSKRTNKHILFPSDSQSALGSQGNQDINAMSVDQVSQVSGGQQVDQDTQAAIHVLTSDEQIILLDNREGQAFQILKDHTFQHTHVYDYDFLN